MITGSINIEIADSIDEAPNYGEDFTMLKMVKGIVVCRGTVQGNPTVDLQLEDEHGNKFLVMATGGIIEAIGKVVETKRKQTGMN